MDRGEATLSAACRFSGGERKKSRAGLFPLSEMGFYRTSGNLIVITVGYEAVNKQVTPRAMNGAANL